MIFESATSLGFDSSILSCYLVQVEPFILNHSPAAFAHSTSVHFQGKADDWLKRLVPMLRSEIRQSQSLAAFHFAMEAAVKNEQQNLKVIISYLSSLP